MLTLTRPLSLMTLAGAVLLLGPRWSVQAQPYPQAGYGAFRVNPYAGQPSPYDVGVARGVNTGYRAGFQVGTFNNPYYGSNVYGSYADPYNGYLSGAADVIGAQAQFLKAREQANLTKEQVNQAKIETRRRNLDEYLYERQVTPTIEDERERARMEALRRARNDPPVNEILSSTALNTLLKAVQQVQSQGVRGPDVSLDQGMLRHINVTGGAPDAGSLGVLRDGGKLRWPLVLATSDYQATRSRLDDLALQAYQQAGSGQVDADTLVGMTKAVNDLLDQLKEKIADYTPNDYIRGKRFLHEISDAIRVLQDPNVANFVTRKWSARGNTVYLLVGEMTRQGLQFAPALDGDQPAYVALHSAMVTYDTGLIQLVMAQGPALKTAKDNR